MDIVKTWLKSTEIQLAGNPLNCETEIPIIALYEACSDEPDKAIEIISGIIEQKPSDKLLACLGAGPIEELLVKHPKYLGKLIKEVSNHAALRVCLQHVDVGDDDSIDASMLNDFLAVG